MTETEKQNSVKQWERFGNEPDSKRQKRLDIIEAYKNRFKTANSQRGNSKKAK